MDLDTLDSPVLPTISELEAVLGAAFPQYKISRAWLLPKTLLLRNGMVVAIVQQRKNVVRVKGRLNAQNVGVLLPITLGVVFGLAGALIVLLVLYLIFGERAWGMEKEVSDFLKDHLKGNSKVIGVV